MFYISLIVAIFQFFPLSQRGCSDPQSGPRQHTYPRDHIALHIHLGMKKKDRKISILILSPNNQSGVTGGVIFESQH